MIHDKYYMLMNQTINHNDLIALNHFQTQIDNFTIQRQKLINPTENKVELLTIGELIYFNRQIQTLWCFYGQKLFNIQKNDCLIYIKTIIKDEITLNKYYVLGFKNFVYIDIIDSNHILKCTCQGFTCLYK